MLLEILPQIYNNFTSVSASEFVESVLEIVFISARAFELNKFSRSRATVETILSRELLEQRFGS